MQTQQPIPQSNPTTQFGAYDAKFTMRKQELITRVAMIDLGPIKYKLAHEDGFTAEQLSLMEDLYRKYLVLTQLLPSETIVPTKFIDTMWHAHILDTAKYRADCNLAFETFLDHFPYLGLRGVEDEAMLVNSFARTKEFFSEIFGEQIVGQASECEGTECGGTACGASNCDRIRSTERPSLN